MLRFLWKCVLEVLPPTCATVAAGILLSAYHEHALPLQDVIDPRASFERVQAPDGGKQQQAVIAPQVQSEHATEPAGIDSKVPAPGSDARRGLRALAAAHGNRACHPLWCPCRVTIQRQDL